LFLEATQDVKHEYLHGEMFAMAGGSPNHDAISLNISVIFHAAVRHSQCRAFTSNMRIRTPSGLYTYPDASIVCGEPDVLHVQGTETIGNPVALVEVLSKSTGDYDRTAKFDLYRSIPTLRDYILIEQSRIGIEHRYVVPGGGWTVQNFETPDQRVCLTGVDVELPVDLVYERVKFT